MISFLKNIAFRFWSSGLLALMASLWLLPHTGEVASLATSLMVFGILFGALFAGIGWLTDYIVRRQLQPLLQEAGMLERGGLGPEAEQTFEKALALLDSFMVSPRRRRRYLQALGARMARFYAAQAEKNGRAYKWITRYLGAFPGDRAIAEVWLQDMEHLAAWSKFQQDLAARIGDARYDDPRIQMVLARVYIRGGRTDFAALQAYRRVMESSRDALGGMIRDLSRLFIKEGRADETALQAYVMAARRGEPTEDLLCGLAACLRWIENSDRTRGLIDQARSILGPVSTDARERMSSGFLPPTGRYEPDAEARRSGTTRRAGFDQVARWARNQVRRLQQGLGKAATPLASKRLKRLLKTGLIGGLGLAAVALIFNTAGHLVPPPTPPASPAQDTAVKVEPKPYTLQVAAYLQPVHAERFIKALQDRGQDAYRVEAQSHQKTWYQVRVGHFPTKAAARAYGQRLKDEGIIEDFYVANYPDR
jgi:hypothetical protein